MLLALGMASRRRDVERSRLRKEDSYRGFEVTEILGKRDSHSVVQASRAAGDTTGVDYEVSPGF